MKKVFQKFGVNPKWNCELMKQFPNTKWRRASVSTVKTLKHTIKQKVLICRVWMACTLLTEKRCVKQMPWHYLKLAVLCATLSGTYVNMSGDLASQTVKTCLGTYITQCWPLLCKQHDIAKFLDCVFHLGVWAHMLVCYLTGSLKCFLLRLVLPHASASASFMYTGLPMC